MSSGIQSVSLYSSSIIASMSDQSPAYAFLAISLRHSLAIQINKDRSHRLTNQKKLVRQEADRLKSNLEAAYVDVEVNASYLLELAHRLPELFKSSRAELKNKILKIIFSNFKIQQKMVLPSLLEPFASLASDSKMSNVAPGAGLEPATSKLTASCSTIELPGINSLIITHLLF